MASILSVDTITGVTNTNYSKLPSGVVDGVTITFVTVASNAVLALANGGIQLSHLSPAVLQQVTAQSSVSLPGTIIQCYGINQPPGTLLCTGQAVSRTTYSALFAAIGTTFGTGDGSTTFNVPNLGGSFYIKY
jgi:hypothetical protein